MKNVVITIDGPAASGKTTCAKMLAEHLGFAFLDTGAMYRAATLGVLRAGIDVSDEDAVAACVEGLSIEMVPNEKGELLVILGGEDVTERIRDEDVTANAKHVAKVPRVRARMVHLQRKFAENRNLVTEGRDQGTVAFPDAPIKFFLDASLKERVRRRKRDLAARGDAVDEAELEAKIARRNHSDRERAAGPLTRSPDMVYIDTSQLDVSAAVSVMEAFVRKAVGNM